MTQIILVRHGQTPWNLDRIFRGSKDIPLNDQGREEARLAGEWRKEDTIHAAYCSPLSRARDTAHAIARHHNLAVADLPGLTDLCYGAWEGGVRGFLAGLGAVGLMQLIPKLHLGTTMKARLTLAGYV